MILIVLVAGALKTSISEEQAKKATCKQSNDDMTNGTYFMAALTVVIALVFILLFRPKYLRMEAERRERTGRSIESSTHD